MNVQPWIVTAIMFITFIGAVIGFWVNFQNKVTILEEKVKNLEAHNLRIECTMVNHEKKNDDTFNQLYNINREIQSKLDKLIGFFERTFDKPHI